MSTKTEVKDPIAAALRNAIERTEKTHAAIYARDVQPNGENARWIGPRPSQAMLDGSSYDPARSAARDAAKGMWSPCARDAGGCGGIGYQGGEERGVCEVCGGAGRIASAAGLELMRFFLTAIGDSQPKPDATPEAIAAHNENARLTRAAREQADRARQEKAMQERALLSDTAQKIAALRGEAFDPIVEHEHARRVHEATNQPGKR